MKGWRIAVLIGGLILGMQARAQEGTPAPPGDTGSPGDAGAADAPVDPAAPAEAAPVAARDEGAATVTRRIRATWGEALRALRAGGFAAAQEKIDDLRRLRSDVGIPGLPAVARALIAEGYKLMDGKDYESAAECFRAAIDFDPAGQEGRLALASLARQRHPASPGFLAHAYRAIAARPQVLRSMPYAVGNWLLTLAAGAWLAGILSIAGLTLRKNSLLRHDVMELTKAWVPADIAKLLGWVVLVLPLLLGFDLYWAAVYWAVLVWPYGKTVEQVVIGLSLVGAALLLPAVSASTYLLRSHAQPYTSAAVEFLDGMVGPSTRKALVEYVQSHPEDGDARLLLAQVYERNGESRDAIEFYRTLEPSPDVLNNMANIHYRLGEKDQAFALWRKALERDPGFAAAYYNLSHYYFDFFEFDKKDENFRKAKELDSKAVDRWVAVGSGVADTGIDLRRVRERLIREARTAGLVPILEAVKTPHFVAAAAALVLCIGLGKKRQAGGVASECQRCGRAYCRECARAKERPDYCLQCFHLFLRKDGVSPQMRNDKMREIGRNQLLNRVGSIVAGLVAPGAGQLYGGRTLAGWLFLCVWSVSLAAYVVISRSFLEPGFVARSATAIPAWLALVPAGLVWVAANLSNLLRRS